MFYKCLYSIAGEQVSVFAAHVTCQQPERDLSLYSKQFIMLVILTFLHIQSNLCTTTVLGTPNLWPLLTGGCCSEVDLCYKYLNWDPKMVVTVGRWSLIGDGCKRRFDCSKLGIYSLNLSQRILIWLIIFDSLILDHFGSNQIKLVQIPDQNYNGSKHGRNGRSSLVGICKPC